MNQFLTLVLIQLLIASFSFNLQAQTHKGDSLILVQLFNSTGGNSWTNKSNWLTRSADSWFGIYVNPETKRVERIQLRNNNLTGTIPSAITNLDSLKKLVLSDNNLYGAIPELHKILYFNNGTTSLDEEVLLNNFFTFLDIESNAKAKDQYLNGSTVNISVYSGLRAQKTFGPRHNNYRAAEGQDIVISAGNYRGTASNVFRWYRGSTLVATTKTPAYTIKNFNPDIFTGNRGKWYCRVFYDSLKNNKFQEFTPIGVEDTQNDIPVIEMTKTEHSVKDKMFPQHQIRTTDSSFSIISLGCSDDLPTRDLKYKIEWLPENLYIRIGKASQYNTNDFIFEPVADSMFGYSEEFLLSYDIQVRRKNPEWTGKDSLVIGICDHEGGCTKSTYYFTSVRKFTPESPGYYNFNEEISRDGDVVFSWNNISDADKLILKYQYQKSDDCLSISDTLWSDSVTVDISQNKYQFPHKVPFSEDGYQQILLTVYPVNSAGISESYNDVINIPPLMPAHSFNYTIDEAGQVDVSWEYEHKCQDRMDLFRIDRSGTDSLLEYEIYYDGSFRDYINKEDTVRYVLRPSNKRKSVFYISSDTLVVFMKDQKPFIKSTLSWQFQNRLSKRQSTIAGDDRDKILLWEFQPARHFQIIQNRDTVSFKLKDATWKGSDTIRFSVSDSRKNRLDTFAVIHVISSNTPPRFSVSSETSLSVAVKKGSREELDLKWFIADNETLPSDIIFSMQNTSGIPAVINGSILSIPAPLPEDEGVIISVFAKDEADAKDTMYIKVLLNNSPNQPPRIDLGEIRSGLFNPVYVTDKYPVYNLKGRATDDGPAEDLKWYAETITPGDDRVALEVVNDSLYIKINQQEVFSFMDLTSTPVKRGDWVPIYIYAEDKQGARDSAEIILTIGEKFPLFKKAPFSEIFPGDTIRFSPLNFAVFREGYNPADLDITVQNFAATSGTVSNEGIASIYSPMPGPVSLPQNVYIFFTNKHAEAGWKIPVIVHSRKNTSPDLLPVPSQYSPAGTREFPSVNLPSYVSDDVTPAEQLFWYVNDAEHIDVDFRDGKLYATKKVLSWTGSDTITVIAEDLEYTRDSVRVILISGEENYPPSISEIPLQQITRDENVHYMNLNNFVKDDHTPTQLIRWNVSSSDHLHAIISDGSAYVTLKDSTWHGTDSLKFYAEDEQGLIESVTVKFETSVIDQITVNSENHILLSPNPASEYLNITFSKSFSTGNINATLLYADGRMVNTFKIPNSSGYILKTDGLSKGVYYLIFDADNYREVKPLVITD